MSGIARVRWLGMAGRQRRAAPVRRRAALCGLTAAASDFQEVAHQDDHEQPSHEHPDIKNIPSHHTLQQVFYSPSVPRYEYINCILLSTDLPPALDSRAATA